jgi:hypothetical protein
MKEIKVIYDPIDGTVVPDGKIDSFLDLVEDLVIVGSETMMLELRARHMEKRIKITSLIYREPPDEFGPNETLLEFDDGGRIVTWPRGFCDKADDCLARLLGWIGNDTE